MMVCIFCKKGLFMKANPRIAWRIAYHQVFSTEEVEEIRLLQGKYWDKGTVEGEKIEEDMRMVSVQPYLGDMNQAWVQKLYDCVQAANTAIWNFDIAGFHQKEPLQFLQYTQHGHYEWHIDHDSQSPTRKLTFILQLSSWKDYRGGGLQFFPKITHVSEATLGKVGTLIVFPVYVPHQVQPMVFGVREALVGWIHGPSFR